MTKFNEQVNNFGQQPSFNNSNFGQPFAQQASFGQQATQQGTFGQQNTGNTHVNSFEQCGSTNSSQTNAFDQQNKQNPFGHPSQSSMSFGQANESGNNSQVKGSFGHPSESSFTPRGTEQQSAAFQQTSGAPFQAAGLKPDGRMINKTGRFLGRVQATPSEGCAVTIKRLGKPKFFDYKTVDECLRE